MRKNAEENIGLLYIQYIGIVSSDAGADAGAHGTLYERVFKTNSNVIDTSQCTQDSVHCLMP